MTENPETNYRAWIEKAEEDMLAIENNVSADRVPWSVVCFHAQQGVEKTLKAFLVYHGATPERTHNLVALLERCVGINPVLDTLEEECRSLSFYAVETRYPSLHVAGEEEGRAMTEAARRICARILALLPDAA